MQLSSIKLLNFRNYENLELTFSPKINILYGLNGMGKTGLIEAIYMLAITKTFKSNIDDVVIKKGKNIAKIEGLFQDEITTNHKIIISKNGKRVKINNNICHHLSDYITKINVVIFTPDDLRIIKDSPSVRRKLLNIEISGINKEYLLYLNQYNKILKQRNAYLKSLSKSNTNNFTYLEVITDKLIELGLKIMLIRDEFINNINLYLKDIYQEITHKGNLILTYKSIFLEKDFNALKNIYQKNRSKEIFMGKTLFGIHHDDIEFQIDNEIVKEFSSVGEQKNSILAFKLAEIKNIEEKIHKKPILLLDDLFSELDKYKINNLLKLIDTNLQTFITTTDLDMVDTNLLTNAKLFHVVNGTIKEEVNNEK